MIYHVNTLLFINASAVSGTVCIFQTLQGEQLKNTHSIAWLTKEVESTTEVQFGWALDYGFVGAPDAQLEPGSVVTDCSFLPARPGSEVTYSCAGGACEFSDLRGGPPGSLTIRQDATVSPTTGAVGIGMALNPTILTPALPNVIATFYLPCDYWIVFGRFEEGEVLDVADLSNRAEIDFTKGGNSMQAKLNRDFTWTIKPAIAT